MKNFQIMRYLKRLLPIIVVLCVLATYGINHKLKNDKTCAEWLFLPLRIG